MRLSVRVPAPVTHLPGPAPGACFAGPRSPWSPSLAPPAPRRIAPPCSPASQLLRQSQTSRARASPATTPRLPDADLRRPSAGQTRDLPVPVQRASAHARVFDHAGWDGTRAIAPPVLPSALSSASAPGSKDFSRLNGWPMRSPVNASPTPSRVSTHDSGASVVRYTFTARDFHSLLFAGFAGAPIMSFIGNH